MDRAESASVGVSLELEGTDSLGNSFKSVEEMWSLEFGPQGSKQQATAGSPANWEQLGLEYWKKAEASYEGVLGGYGFTHDIDVADNDKLLVCLKKIGMKPGRAIEMGAGVGRLVKDCFVRHFQLCDLLEPADNLIAKAKELLASHAHMGVFYHASMQQFDFEHRYDCIWFQWVIGHLTDKQAVDFLAKCREALTPSVVAADQGFIVLKENLSSQGTGFYLDREDHTVMRSLPYFRQLFEKAGLVVKIQDRFRDFPVDCLPVFKFVLRPAAVAKQSVEEQVVQKE